MNLVAALHVILALVLSPLLIGVINRTKAFFAGRRGQSLLQLYYDIAKLLRKGAVYSGTTTWLFRAGPPVCLACVAVALLLLPFGGTAALVSFRGDLILFAYLLGLARFATVLAALDTGSAFEGMGASREVTFSALAEPALLVSLAVLTHQTGTLSLSGMYGGIAAAWIKMPCAIVLIGAALLLVFLAENARIPVDDPTTHLELTMIHEVMVLDHGGPDFAMIQYGAALKLWVLGALLVGLLLPLRSGHALIDSAVMVLGMFGVAVLVGIVESTMARLRLVRVPQLLVGASTCAIVALALVMR